MLSVYYQSVEVRYECTIDACSRSVQSADPGSVRVVMVIAANFLMFVLCTRGAACYCRCDGISAAGSDHLTCNLVNGRGQTRGRRNRGARSESSCGRRWFAAQTDRWSVSCFSSLDTGTSSLLLLATVSRKCLPSARCCSQFCCA